MVRPVEGGAVPLALLLVVGFVVCVTCAPYEPPTTPTPSFSNPDSTTRATFLAYAVSLTYDTNLGAGDQQRLMLGTTCPPWAGGGDCTYGPLARIEPQVGTHLIPDTSALATGRVLARIITVDSQYTKLGLFAGDTTYWWVDKNGPAGWRSVLVPSDTGRAMVHRDSLQLHPVYQIASQEYEWRQAIARFYWSDSDEQLWSTCTNGYCCKLN